MQKISTIKILIGEKVFQNENFRKFFCNKYCTNEMICVAL